MNKGAEIKRGFLSGIPIMPKMLVLTFVAGLAAWLALDYVQTRKLKSLFIEDLSRRLAEESHKDRVRFDNYVVAYPQVAKMAVSRRNFQDYVAGQDFHELSGAVRTHIEVPTWMPGPSAIRKFAHLDYALLLDGRGTVREVYQAGPEPPPGPLLRPTPLQVELSYGQSYMTTIEGKPYLLASEPYKGPDGIIAAALMLAVRFDDEFLINSLVAPLGENIAALIGGEELRVIASSKPDVLPPGTPVEGSKDRYLVAGKGYFDFGASDLQLGFAYFVPLKSVESITGALVQRERGQRAIIAGVFIALFVLIIFRYTRRIVTLTSGVYDFSRKVLGTKTKETGRGDELAILEENFTTLTREVVSTKEELTRARDDLEKKVEERTSELNERNVLLRQEIAERERAEKALRESEARFRALFDQASDAILLFDLSSGVPVIVDANEATCRMHGYTRDELMGKPVTMLDDPEGKSLVLDRAKRIMAGEQLTFEVGHVRKNGSMFPVEVSVRLIRIGDKQYIQAIDRDITERKQAEDERKNLTSTLNTLVEHLPEGVLLFEGKGRLAHANPAGADYIKALSGKGLGEVIEDIAGQPIRELLVSPPRVSWHDIEKDGKVFELAGRSIDGRGMVFVIRDVTEERAAKRRFELHDKIAAVGQLAAGIAHDFNNILTVITGYAEILLESELPQEARQQVAVIQQSGKKAADLVTQILDYSRKTVGELKTIDLIPLINDFTGFISRTIPENIHMTFDYSPGDYVVSADPAKMQQVLANLAVNARDAMPQGGELIIGLSRLLVDKKDMPLFPGMGPGEWVVLTVRDTGMGIEQDILPRIFEPFYTTKEVGKGAGLGLSQVYGIVKQHAGFIDAKSTAGRGSVFVIYLPAAGSPAERPVEEPETAAPKGKGETILVVEDEKSVLYYIQRVLSGLGYRLLTAENGEEGLRVFKENMEDIGLVVTDLVMPVMGGVDLCRGIKAMRPSVKVIAVSGYPSPFVKIEDLDKAGFEEFIKKPFKVSTLAQAVKRTLKS